MKIYERIADGKSFGVTDGKLVEVNDQHTDIVDGGEDLPLTDADLKADYREIH